MQIYGNGFGVWQKLVLPQVVSERDLIRSIVILELSDLIPQEGRLGKFYYKVEGFEPWRVFLKDEETEEEFYEEEDLKDFSTDRIPQPLLGWLLKGWAMEYFKEDVEFEESYEHLFENLILYARGSPFECDDLLKSRVKDYLKLRLYLLLKEVAPLEEVEELLKKAEGLGINLGDERLKFWLEEYISRKVSLGLSEEEAKRLASLVKEYNRSVGRVELMVNLWELQNWAWENRDRVSLETLKLLDFYV